MEPKKSSIQHQTHPMEPKGMNSSPEHHTHPMEPKGKKSSPGDDATVEAEIEIENPLRSLLNPSMKGEKEKDELYKILYKGQNESGQGDMTDGKSQGSPPKSRTAHNKDDNYSQTYESIDTSCFGSSLHYGGRDYYTGSGTMHITESSNESKADKKDPVTDFHGEWWRGSFYY